MENDIKYKSLEAGRRSLGSRGARAPPIFGKSPNCQNKSRNLWDSEMFDHAMKLQGSLDLLRASRPDWRIQKITSLKLQWNQIKIGFTYP